MACWSQVCDGYWMNSGDAGASPAGGAASTVGAVLAFFVPVKPKPLTV